MATSAALRSTAPANAAPDRIYDHTEAALLQADVDYIVHEGRRAVARGESDPVWTFAVFADDIASNRLAEARRVLQSAPGGLHGPIADMLEPFLLSAEGQVDGGVERVDAGRDNLPAPLPEVQRALVFESAGRLAGSGRCLFANGRTPRSDAADRRDEPSDMEEFERALGAARVTHAVYRAALVAHRLGRTADARRYYEVVNQFAPRSVDVERNLRAFERRPASVGDRTDAGHARLAAGCCSSPNF